MFSLRPRSFKAPTFLSSTTRFFSHSSYSLNKIEWFAYIPERPNTDRLPYRGKHLEDIQKNIAKGIITHGSGLFTEVPIPGEPLPPFAGSVVHVLAETKEEVIKVLEEDVYHKMGAWDLKRAAIFPCSIAFSTSRNAFADKEDK